MGSPQNLLMRGCWYFFLSITLWLLAFGAFYAFILITKMGEEGAGWHLSESCFLSGTLHRRSEFANITKTRLFKYIENFTSKDWKFSDKKFWYFSYFCFGLNVFYFTEITTQSYIHTIVIRIWTKAYCLFSSFPNTYNISCEHLWPKHIYRALTIDCGYSLEPPRRGGSNECPQFMFLSRNKENIVYPCKPQFYYIKVGFKKSKLYRRVFVMILPCINAKLLLKTIYAQKVLF